MTHALSPTVFTHDLDRVRRFYTEHFAAEVTFDCGWYLTLQLLGNPAASLSFMAPQTPDTPCFQGGLTLNLQVEDVDGFHHRLIQDAGLPERMPLEDHPWGDRGFCTEDPLGIRLYLYRLIPMAPEFAQVSSSGA